MTRAIDKPLRTYAQALADRERLRETRRQMGVCPHCGIIDRQVKDESGLCAECEIASQNGVDETIDLDVERSFAEVEKMMEVDR